MPFSDITARLQALGVNPFVPSGISGNGPSFRTPGIAPTSNTPSPSGVSTGGGGFGRLLSGLFPTNDPTGLLSAEQQQVAQRQGLLSFGTSLLASSGPQPGPRIGLGAALGQALQAGQGAAAGGIQDQLQGLLLKSKIDENKRRAAAGAQDPALVAEYKFAQANGFTGSFTDYIKSKQTERNGFGNVNPGDFTPESLAKYAQTGNYADLKRYVAPAQPQLAVINGVPTVVNPTRGGGATTLNPLSDPTTEDEAARRRREAEAGGSVTGKVDAERAATFQNDLGVIDDEILRTQRLLTEFQQGKYQTGPLAGKLPNLRTPAQDLERESAKDVLKGISSATFGALSEGERAFISKLGIDPNKNEASNINLLTERLAQLQKTKQRLLSRPPASGGQQPQGGAGLSARPPLSSFRR